VHHVRLATLPFGHPYLAPEPTARAHLDLDDVESVARRRLGELYRLSGRDAEARWEDAEAARVETLERAALRDFERVYVCSRLDRARLLEGAGAEVRVLPNTVEPPIPAPLPSAGYGEGWLVTPARPFRLLFVGTLGYLPNEDAVLYFCRQILPLLRSRSPRPVQLDVVGTGPTAALLALAGTPGVRVTGFAPDLAPWYQQADAVIVPLRAGGGTRIKLLEAFAHMRPIVSTSLGLEGIEAAAGEHLLIADEPDTFAAACLRLMREPAVGQRLTANAAELLRRRYGAEALRRALA
jgi:polysaccharide biosynthesis protein PslH